MNQHDRTHLRKLLVLARRAERKAEDLAEAARELGEHLARCESKGLIRTSDAYDGEALRSNVDRQHREAVELWAKSGSLVVQRALLQLRR